MDEVDHKSGNLPDFSSPLWRDTRFFPAKLQWEQRLTPLQNDFSLLVGFHRGIRATSYGQLQQALAVDRDLARHTEAASEVLDTSD